MEKGVLFMLKEKMYFHKSDMINITTRDHLQDHLYVETNRSGFTEYKIPQETYNSNMNKIIKRYLKEKTTDSEAVIIDEDVLQGMPIIEGTRLPVTLILAYIRDEENFEAILEDFPHITKEQIINSLDYLIKVIGDPYKNE